MKNLSILSLAFLALCSAFTMMVSSAWKLDENDYSISFKGKKVEGIFKGLSSTVVLDDAHPENASITASVEVATLNTGNALMNEHALSEKALDGENHEKITFESETVTKKENQYIATGKLTMKGITKVISIPFDFKETATQGKLTGTFTVFPNEYNITRMGTPDSIDITLNIGYKK